MIVKIQKPLFNSAPNNPAVLIYDEDRDFEMMTPWNEKWEKVFGDDLKQYWEATTSPTAEGKWYLDEIILIKQVATPDW